jgi:hypothetical protein
MEQDDFEPPKKCNQAVMMAEDNEQICCFEREEK